MKILVVENNAEVLKQLRINLENIDCEIELVNTYKKGEILAMSNQYQLLLIGYQLFEFDRIKKIRNKGYIRPIAVLAKEISDESMVLILDSGVDDVLLIDLNQKLFISKINSLLRRISNHYQKKYSLGSITFEPESGILSRDSKILKLTNKELQLMKYFYYNQNITLSKNKLMNMLWGNKDCDDNNLEVYISYLRKKLKQLDPSIIIETKRKLGYTLIIKSKYI